MPAIRHASSLSCPSKSEIVAGATAHCATGNLDEGPIIERDVGRVLHRDTPGAPARAVAWHLDGRVVLDGRNTIVFGD